MTQTVKKGWGKEIIFASNPDYCGKLLVFKNAGAKCSMHFHLNKHETWYVQQGSFRVYWIETGDGSIHSDNLETGFTWTNEQGSPHQLEALEDNSIIFEVSTQDNPYDNYRIVPGDSQK